MGSLYLVRHAKAGDRAHWHDSDDSLRPLEPAGREQAVALAARLATLTTGRLLSSPYLRCVQTLEPLAVAVGTTVGTDDRLAEGASFTAVFDLFDELPDGSVLCSHGDVIPDTIRALERRGCEIIGAASWRKASTWVLTCTPNGIVAAECWPPPG